MEGRDPLQFPSKHPLFKAVMTERRKSTRTISYSLLSLGSNGITAGATAGDAMLQPLFPAADARKAMRRLQPEPEYFVV